MHLLEHGHNKLTSGRYATFPRYHTKDDITYVKHIGYTPSNQEYLKMVMDTKNNFRNFCPLGVFLGWLGGQRSNTVECSALPSGFEPG